MLSPYSRSWFRSSFIPNIELFTRIAGNPARAGPPRRAEMPRQPIKGLATGPLREREHLRKARGRCQLAHGDHGIRSPRGVSLSPPWRATSRSGLISRCTGLFQRVLGQPPFNPVDWNGTEPLDFRPAGGADPLRWDHGRFPGCFNRPRLTGLLCM